MYRWKTVYKKAKDKGSKDEELTPKKWKATGGSVKEGGGAVKKMLWHQIANVVWWTSWDSISDFKW